MSRIKDIKYKEMFHKLIKDIFIDPFYILTHPLKGFDEFKFSGMRKRYVAIFYLLMLCLIRIISFNQTGFLVNTNNPDEFNAIKIILLIIVPVVLFTIGNWSFTTLFDGKGKMEEIFSVICYALIPFVWISIPNLIYSNILIAEEVGFYHAFNYLGIFLMIYMAFFGLLVIHEYGVLKNIVSLIFTAVAIGIIIFIGFLILTIFQQLYDFISSIYREFIMRYR